MPASIQIDDREVLLSLGDFRATVAQRSKILRILGLQMVGSVKQTIKDGGSPAGSWVPFALSTMKRKDFKPHKLLILKGKLFGSIRSTVNGDSVMIGPGAEIPYARVQNDGSADLAGNTGPQARIAGRSVTVGAHDFLLTYFKRKRGKGGKLRRIRGQAKPTVTEVHVGEHERFQNIPGRPYLVLRPEDPANLTEAVEQYIMQRAPKAGVA